MSIYLIRHGETAGNAERRLQRPDIPLNEAGLEQARQLGERLRDAGVGHVLSSDLLRARQTAEAVVRTTGSPIEFDPLLQERNFGDLRGKLYDELDPNLFSEAYDPPGGESGDVFRDRVSRAWQRIVEFSAEVEGRGHLAVVTHGLVYRVMFARHVLSSEADESELPRPGNTAISIIEPTAPHEVQLLACTAHLS
jgi:probable phosphoglycerate mutase